MPELPEVEALSAYLCETGSGRVVSKVDVASFSVLKTFDPPVDSLVGQALSACGRRGKHLLLQFSPSGHWLVLHLARAGWVRVVTDVKPGPVKAGKGPLALRVRFDDGSAFDVTEAGTEKRVAAWVVRSPDDVQNVATLGPDPLDPSFDVPALAAALSAAGRAHVKGVLIDQRVVAGVGNAYSDEALHVARLSPFKPAGSLTAEEVASLHAALVRVLRDAVDRSSGVAAAGLKREKKSGLRVHGRDGETCPDCGDTIRSVFFASKALQYCPTCQTGGKPLADRRLSRLLK